MPAPKISTAVSDCLAECEPIRSTYAQIRAFTDRLRLNPAWTPQEIQQVEWRAKWAILILANDDYWQDAIKDRPRKTDSLERPTLPRPQVGRSGRHSIAT